MDRRILLQKTLERLMLRELPKQLPDTQGSTNAYHVYFQPDQNIKLAYPAITYSLNKIALKRANNALYNYEKSYVVTVIDRNPDSNIPMAVLHLPKTRFIGRNVADGLNHTMFETYF